MQAYVQQDQPVTWRKVDEIANLLIEDKGVLATLSWAAGNRYEVVQLPLEAGVAVEAKDKYSQTPPSRAAGQAHEAVVRYDWTTLW